MKVNASQQNEIVVANEGKLLNDKQGNERKLPGLAGNLPEEILHHKVPLAYPKKILQVSQINPCELQSTFTQPTLGSQYQLGPLPFCPYLVPPFSMQYYNPLLSTIMPPNNWNLFNYPIGYANTISYNQQ